MTSREQATAIMGTLYRWMMFREGLNSEGEVIKYLTVALGNAYQAGLRDGKVEAYRDAEAVCVLGAEATFISEAVRQDRKRTGKLIASKAAALKSEKGR